MNFKKSGLFFDNSFLQFKSSRQNDKLSGPWNFQIIEIIFHKHKTFQIRPEFSLLFINVVYERLFQVGTHVINTIHKFLYQPITKKDREAAEKRKLQAALKQRMAKTQGKKTFSSQLFNLVPKDCLTCLCLFDTTLVQN